MASNDYLVCTTASPIEDFEELAVVIRTAATPQAKHNAAIHLRDALRDAFGDYAVSAIVGDEWVTEYNPVSISARISEAAAYMDDHPAADSREAAEALQNPIAGLYAAFRVSGDRYTAEVNTRAAMLYCYALRQAAVAMDEERKRVQPQRPAAADCLPSWALSERAMTIYAEMEKRGFMRIGDEGWEWTSGSDRRLAYFVAKLNDELRNVKRNTRGKQRREWKPFEELFGKTELCRSFNDYRCPGEWSEVDVIFTRNSK